MDDLAYVSSTVLRSVSCRQTGPKNQGLTGTAQGTLSSSAGLVNCFSGSSPVPPNKSPDTAPKITCVPSRRGGMRNLDSATTTKRSTQKKMIYGPHGLEQPGSTRGYLTPN